MPEEILTTKQVMARLQVGEKTLRRLRAEGKLPYLQISKGIIRYRASDCAAYLEACLRRAEPPRPPQPSAKGPRRGKAVRPLEVGGFLAMREACRVTKPSKKGA